MSVKKGKFTGGGYAPPRLGPNPVDPPSPAHLRALSTPEPPATPTPTPKKLPASGRTARLQVWVIPEAEKAFRMLQIETGRKGPDLLHEALNLLFRKHGKPEVQ